MSNYRGFGGLDCGRNVVFIGKREMVARVFGVSVVFSMGLLISSIFRV